MTESYPESPCIGLCQMDGDRRYCMGCGRTLNEIASWSTLSADEKRRVIDTLPTRARGEPPGGRRDRSA